MDRGLRDLVSPDERGLHGIGLASSRGRRAFRMSVEICGEWAGPGPLQSAGSGTSVMAKGDAIIAARIRSSIGPDDLARRRNEPNNCHLINRPS